MTTAQVDLEGVPVLSVAPALLRRDRWVDLLFVLGVTLWQPIFTSTAYALHWISVPPSHSDLRVFSQILAQMAGFAVLVYVLWKRGSGIYSLTRAPGWGDFPRGLMLYIAAYIAAVAATVPVNFVWRLSTGHLPVREHVGQILGMQATLIWLVLQFVNPWFEELIVRGFLMTEVRALVGVRTAIIASTLVQVSYHLYQGWMNAAIVAVIFLIYSLYYARTRRLLPVILAHTLQDVLALEYYLHHG